MPWPEEGNRVAIDALVRPAVRADRAAAPPTFAREGVAGAIYVTGNTGIDALARRPARASARSTPSRNGPRRCRGCSSPVTGARIGVRGSRTIAPALIELAEAGRRAVEAMLHPNPRIDRRDATRCWRDRRGIRLSLPSDHRGMVERMRRADLLLSDSGGIQEEAPALGVPLLVLRDRTERPEAMARGNALLVGDRPRPDRRRSAPPASPTAPRSPRMARPALPFGDGQAAPRIARHICDWLARRDRPELARASAPD